MATGTTAQTGSAQEAGRPQPQTSVEAAGGPFIRHSQPGYAPIYNVTGSSFGGIVTQPTTFMAGDSKSGGSADEAILPLSDPEAMSRVGQSLLKSIVGSTREAPGFQFAPPATGERPGFSFGPSTPSPGAEFRSGTPTVGEALGFHSAEPSASEKPDMEALAARFSSLLSTPTLRAASAAMGPAPTEARSAAQQSSPDRRSAISNEKDSRSDPWGEGASGGGDTHHHYYNIKGMVSPDTLKKLTNQQNRMVKNRQLTLNASNSLRVTRRSQ